MLRKSTGDLTVAEHGADMQCMQGNFQ